MESLLTKLRQNTKHLHDVIEKVMYSSKIMDGSISQKELNHLLLINYIFFLKFEAQLFKIEALKEYHHPRANLAKNDLITLGEKPMDYLDCLELPNLSTEEMYGFLYVALGSSLGGQMIANGLKKNENIDSSNISFFENSKESFKIWKKFKSNIELLESSLNHNLVVEAAQLAFKTFENIYKKTTIS